MATQLAIAGAALAPPPAAEELPRLHVFRTVPPRHSVAVLAGAVLVYDEGASLTEIEEGALYVIEHQRAPAGMLPETYHRQSLEWIRLRQPQIQLETTREIVRVARWWRDPECWQYTRADGFTEFPLYEWGLTSMIAGRVVGIYAPKALELKK